MQLLKPTKEQLEEYNNELEQMRERIFVAARGNKNSLVATQILTELNDEYDKIMMKVFGTLDVHIRVKDIK